MERNVYLQTSDLFTVKKRVDDIVRRTAYDKQEPVAVPDAMDRITAEPVVANLSSPTYSASAMDGIAIDAQDTYEATPERPVRLNKNQYQYINTGDPIPPHSNAVVMIEDVSLQEDSIVLMNSVRPYENVRPIGEDIIQSDVILPRYHRIRPIDVSAMLSAGITELSVLRRPRVAILPTGDEIIRDIREMKPGKIIDSNSSYLSLELRQIGAEPWISDVIPDRYELLERAILEAVKQYDVVLIGAGSSAGSKDFAKAIIAEHGEVYVHGIGIKPGKPAILGQIAQTPIIGVPGYPVSTYIIYEELIKPMVLGLLHQSIGHKNHLTAELATKVYSTLKHHEFVRVKLGYVDGRFVAVPLDRKAGSSRSVVDADAILEIPKSVEGFHKGDMVPLYVLTNVEDIKRKLVVIGSHDIILDVLRDRMIPFGYDLSSTHVGSLSGILAIQSNSCHLAPVHILQDNGSYNDEIPAKYLTEDYVILKGVGRIQGWYVKPGNPKGFRGISDLTRNDITFVNRQRGSGTRTLLDHHLTINGIEASRIKGYDFELSTHTLVASSVKDARFDVGLGIASVASMYGLDFIPLAEEEYDFVVAKKTLDDPMMKTFLTVLKSDAFASQVQALGGYVIGDIGTVIGGERR